MLTYNLIFSMPFLFCQAKRGVRRKTISDENSGGAGNQTASVVRGVTPSTGGAQDLAGFHVVEAEKNSQSADVSSWLAGKKRPAGAIPASRHRSVESTELDLTTINEQLCNRRFIVKLLPNNAKVGGMTCNIDL